MLIVGTIILLLSALLTICAPERPIIKTMFFSAPNFYWQGMQVMPSHLQEYLSLGTEKNKRGHRPESEKENLYSFIITKDPIWSVNLDFRLISFNTAFEELFISMAGRLPQKGDNILRAGFLPEVTGRYKQYYERAFTGERFIETEHTETPYEFWSEISFHPISDGIKIIGVACHAQDTTEKKLLTMQREKMTADLIQQNKNLEQFAYMVSHNLRAPLANIIGFCKILRLPGENEQTRNEFIEGILRSSEKLDEVIIDMNDILHVKQCIEEKKIPVNFYNMINNIVLSFDEAIKESQTSITCDFMQISCLTTVKSYMYSIFYNLISNSIKYRRENVHNEIVIKSSVTGNKVELLYKDNGMGIDLEKFGDKVFGLYQRFHGEVEGKGLGLFMIRNQVEALGGTISLNSIVNHGTSFKIEFTL